MQNPVQRKICTKKQCAWHLQRIKLLYEGLLRTSLTIRGLQLITKRENDNAPASEYYLLRKSSALHVHLCKQLRGTLKIVTNTQVLLTHKDDGLPLVVDELVSVSSLKVIDELDEIAVTVVAMVLGTQEVRQLTLALDVVDADLALH